MADWAFSTPTFVPVPLKNMRGRHKNMTDPSYLSCFLGAEPVKNMTIRHKNTPGPSCFSFFGGRDRFVVGVSVSNNDALGYF